MKKEPEPVEYQPTSEDRISVWAELNKGIVMSDNPLRFEEVSELIQLA